jgi:lysophospholipase L1-like esterase
MADLTVSSNIDTFLQSANNASARSNLGLGTYATENIDPNNNYDVSINNSLPQVENEIDLFILAGQSNAAGAAFYTNLDAKYKLATPDHLIWTGSAFETLQIGTNHSEAGSSDATFTSMVPPFAYHAAERGRNVAFLNMGFSSTDLYTDWKPTTTVGQKYANLKTAATQSIAALVAAGYRRININGLVWLQGENDAGSDLSGSGVASYYSEYLEALIADFRTHVSAEKLPVVIVQIKALNAGYPYNNDVIAEQVAVAAADENVMLVDTAGSDFTLRADQLHFDAAGQVRIAEEVFKLIGAPRSGVRVIESYDDALASETEAGISKLASKTAIATTGSPDAITSDNFFFALASNRYFIASDFDRWTMASTGTGAISTATATAGYLTLATNVTAGNEAWGKVSTEGQKWKGFFAFSRQVRLSARILNGGSSANTVFRCLLGKDSSEGVGALASAGIGFELRHQTLWLVGHNGTTSTEYNTGEIITSSSNIVDIIVESDGAGNLEIFKAGVSVGTTTGGPTANTANSHTYIYAEVENNADATNASFRVSGVMADLGT